MVDRLFGLGFVVCGLMLADSVLAADVSLGEKQKTEPVDSTVMFKKIPSSAEDEKLAVSDIFELPDILQFNKDEKSKPGNDKSANKDQGKASQDDQVQDLKLPMSLVKIGIPKKDAAKPKDPENVTADDILFGDLSGKGRNSDLVNLVDATKFDIAGISLGMDAEKVQEIAEKQGFEVTDVTYSVPNFLKWKYRDLCESNGVYVYEQKTECVDQIADARKQRYISVMVIDKPEMKERIKISFASNFNKNMAYRIEYTVQGDYSLGTSARPVFLKRERRKAFWNRIFTKYGMPSDLSELLWTEGYDKPYLKTYMNMSTTGARIVLEDISIADSDTYYMYRENQIMPASTLFSF